MFQFQCLPLPWEKKRWRTSHQEGEGDLPLPDDFDDNGTGDLFGDDSGEEDNGVSLPGIG